MFTVATVLNALELGFIYALVAMALFLSFRVLNIADMTTDGAFTLGCAVSATGRRGGHPFLGAAAGHAGRCGGGLYHRVFADKARCAVDSGGHHHQHGAVHGQPCGHGLLLQRAHAENQNGLYRCTGDFWRERTL